MNIRKSFRHGTLSLAGVALLASVPFGTASSDDREGDWETRVGILYQNSADWDFSGGTTIERHALERRLIGHEIGFEKLIFGSDTAPEKIAHHIRRWDTIFDMLDVPEDCRERMWWENGAELYGLMRPSWQVVEKQSRPVRIARRSATKAKATKSAAQRARRDR